MYTVPLGTSGEQVSKLCLGAMFFGTKQDRNLSFRLLDQYVEAGGSFIDTANIYAHWVEGCQGGESETVLGEWMRERRNRQDLFLATKVGFELPGTPRSLKAAQIELEIERSLRRLGVEMVDLYYAHVDDRSILLEETLEAFDRRRAGAEREFDRLYPALLPRSTRPIHRPTGHLCQNHTRAVPADDHRNPAGRHSFQLFADGDGSLRQLPLGRCDRRARGYPGPGCNAARRRAVVRAGCPGNPGADVGWRCSNTRCRSHTMTVSHSTPSIRITAGSRCLAAAVPTTAGRGISTTPAWICTPGWVKKSMPLAPGVVVFAGWMDVRGNATMIDHGWGVYSAYLHQSEFKVKVGDKVETGQVIGLVGGTGRAGGPHLHFEILVGDVPVNPLDWLQQAYP